MIKGLPVVTAQGYVQRDAEFRKIGDKGGFLKFTIKCYDDNGRMDDKPFASYYVVDQWLSEPEDLMATLVKDTPISVKGIWKITKGKKGVYYNAIRAETIEKLEE